MAFRHTGKFKPHAERKRVHNVRGAMDVAAHHEPPGRSSASRRVLEQRLHGDRLNPGLLLDALRWRRSTITFWVVVGLGAGLFGVLVVKPKFTATSELLLETRRVQTLANDTANATPVDMAVVESQVETLKSDGIARAVVDKLGLWNDAEFAPPGDRAPSASTTDTVQRRQAALNRFKKAMQVLRSGRSYVTQVSFTSLDPNRAATIANALAQAYLDDQFRAKAQSAQRAGEWMEGRLDKLRQQASSGAQAVETFKLSNNIIVDASGKLATERELDELSASLAKARAETSQARARVDRMQASLAASKSVQTKDNGTAARAIPVVADELSNQVILRLRQQYLDVAKQEAEWSAREGANHPAAVNLRTELASLQNSIQDEVARISAAYSSDLQIAEERERSIEKRMTEVFQNTAASREGLVKLRGLETEAQTYKTLYETSLARYTQNVEQQTFPVLEARVVSEATPPADKSSPRVTLILLLSGLAGGMLGLGSAARKEYVESLVRSADQLEHNGVAALGQIATVPGRLLLPKRRNAPPLLLRDRLDTLRAVLVAIGEACEHDDSCVIGITSAQAGEGKTTIAFNLATLMGESNKRVLLIDANLHHPTLTRALARGRGSLLDVVAGRTPLEDAVVGGDYTCDVLGVEGKTTDHPSAVLSSEGMRELIAQARHQYDFIVLDLPDLMHHVDGRAAAKLLDAFVIVVEWGRTGAHTLRTLATANGIASRLIGGLINKSPR
jgi:uncharacterized protein involved in exopolysaccharide biosynthesis/Mrp family chromosome partitioning ATPase